MFVAATFYDFLPFELAIDFLGMVIVNSMESHFFFESWSFASVSIGTLPRCDVFCALIVCMSYSKSVAPDFHCVLFIPAV